MARFVGDVADLDVASKELTEDPQAGSSLKELSDPASLDAISPDDTHAIPLGDTSVFDIFDDCDDEYLDVPSIEPIFPDDANTDAADLSRELSREIMADVGPTGAQPRIPTGPSVSEDASDPSKSSFFKSPKPTFDWSGLDDSDDSPIGRIAYLGRRFMSLLFGDWKSMPLRRRIAASGALAAVVCGFVGVVCAVALPIVGTPEPTTAIASASGIRGSASGATSGRGDGSASSKSLSGSAGSVSSDLVDPASSKAGAIAPAEVVKAAETAGADNKVSTIEAKVGNGRVYITQTVTPSDKLDYASVVKSAVKLCAKTATSLKGRKALDSVLSGVTWAVVESGHQGQASFVVSQKPDVQLSDASLADLLKQSEGYAFCQAWKDAITDEAVKSLPRRDGVTPVDEDGRPVTLVGVAEDLVSPTADQEAASDSAKKAEEAQKKAEEERKKAEDERKKAEEESQKSQDASSSAQSSASSAASSSNQAASSANSARQNSAAAPANNNNAQLANEAADDDKDASPDAEDTDSGKDAEEADSQADVEKADDEEAGDDASKTKTDADKGSDDSSDKDSGKDDKDASDDVSTRDSGVVTGEDGLITIGGPSTEKPTDEEVAEHEAKGEVWVAEKGHWRDLTEQETQKVTKLVDVWTCSECDEEFDSRQDLLAHHEDAGHTGSSSARERREVEEVVTSKIGKKWVIDEKAHWAKADDGEASLASLDAAEVMAEANGAQDARSGASAKN